MKAFKYIKDNGGIDSEESYPYEGEENTCRYDPNSSVAQDKGFTVLKKGSEIALKKAVATIGPSKFDFFPFEIIADRKFCSCGFYGRIYSFVSAL